MLLNGSVVVDFVILVECNFNMIKNIIIVVFIDGNSIGIFGVVLIGNIRVEEIIELFIIDILMMKVVKEGNKGVF